MSLEVALVGAILVLVLVALFVFHPGITRVKLGPFEIGGRRSRKLENIRELQETVREHDWDAGHLRQEPVWSEVRAYLPDKMARQMESGFGAKPQIRSGRQPPTDKERILDQLAEMERECLAGSEGEDSG